MNGPTLAFAMGLEPRLAIEHLESKGQKVSGGWREVDETNHARAFTVANVTKMDVLKDIQDELVRAQRDGLTMQQFRENLIPTLTRKGWFAGRGEPVRVPDGTPADPATGELATQKRLTARRLQTIFQTNMQSSMMAGRYRELMGNVDKRPWFQYVAVMDGRTRPAHRAMNGRVFRYDDPGWQTWWPPCGWNCRCRVRARSAADLADDGLTPESSAGHLRKSHVPLPDGSTSTVTRYTPKDGSASFAPDPGFNGNPALIQAADRLAVLRAPQVLPAAQAEDALRTMFTSDQRITALKSFASTAREARQPLGVMAGVGALDDAATLKLVDEGIKFDPAGAVLLEDRLLGGRKAGRHAAAGDALALEDWVTLPRVLAYGQLWWNKANGTLVYAASRRMAYGNTSYPGFDRGGRETWIRVVVRSGKDGNLVRHAALVNREDLNGLEEVRPGVMPQGKK